MIETMPRVYLIGRPQIDTEQMLRYLRDVTGQEDGGTWWNRVGAKIALQEIPAAEGLVEFMGRLCYRSWEPGLNRNVTKVREDRREYLTNILRSGHGSILQHAWFNFVIHNGSRVFTAEMNRHAVGTAISEQSLRYVRLDDDIPFRSPVSVLKPETVELGRALVEHIEDTIGDMYKIEGIDDESFFTKKTVTSAIRRYAPLGMSTEEGWSGNIRAIRHVIEMRTDPHAEEEIRIIAEQIASQMAVECPLLFADYERKLVNDGDLPSHWDTEFRKV